MTGHREQSVPFSRLLRRSVVLSLGLVLLAACDRDDSYLTEVSAVHSDIARFVTGEVARGLNAEGLFTLAPAAPPAGLPIVTEARAGQLAVAYLRTFGLHRASLFRRERGADIDMRSLEMEPRIFFADTPHEPFPSGGHPAYTRYAGPYYLVHFTSGGERVLLIAVSAYASDVRIDERGMIELPTFAGGEFQPVAVSINPTTGPTRYVPISPEQTLFKT